ncbi:translation initiation factor IF-5A [Candidatus Woesearchaeota archaeon]|nr:translation initiation factor IF-5A [Candidatus Woesearchaeota archaeon]
MSETKIVTVATLKPGSYVLIDGAPCVIKDTQVSKSGKHGHAKMRMVAVGLIDERKRDVVMPSQDNIEVPIIEKRTAQVLSTAENMANVMDVDTYETFDIEIPAELKETIKSGVQVLYWTILDKKVMKQLKGGE